MIRIASFSLALLLAASVQAFTIKITTLECRNQQEASGDEIKIKVTIDGGAPVELGIQKMKTGDTWSIQRSFNANNSVKLDVWEHDPTGSDLLGSTTLTSAGSGSKEMVKKGARAFSYLLNWE